MVDFFVRPCLVIDDVNYFDDGAEGNYWNDYHGTDINGDLEIHLTLYITIAQTIILNSIDISTIPEFPSWGILPLFITLIVLIILSKRKLNKTSWA